MNNLHRITIECCRCCKYLKPLETETLDRDFIHNGWLCDQFDGILPETEFGNEYYLTVWADTHVCDEFEAKIQDE